MSIMTEITIDMTRAWARFVPSITMVVIRIINPINKYYAGIIILFKPNIDIFIGLNYSTFDY